MWQLQNTIANTWACIEGFLEPPLRNLDPSLFQNIILGILAIFIPFAIVFLTDLLGSKNQRSEFEKMVLSEEVLGTKKVFWLAVIGIVVLAFFSGTDVSIARKILAIIFSIILILLFWNPFRRILRFSEGYKPEFEISFLKSLNLSKIFRFENKLKMDRMIRAWNSFWSEKSTYNEREFTKEFINHIDQAIESEKSGLAVMLAQAYEKNLDKRDRFSIGYEILPKLFEWHQKFRESEQKWLNRENYKDRVLKSFSAKHFPTFKKWAAGFLSKSYSKDDFFWNWHYFQQGLFPAVAKVLLQDGHGPYQLFTSFKKHIDDAVVKLEKIEDEDKKQRWWNYIMGLFGSFCPIFFDTIDSVPGNYDIWHHYFPADWKVTIANSKNRVPRIILHEFLEWVQKRIFKENPENYDKDLSEVANGIFPNAHHSLFPAFITLLFASEIKYAVQKEPNFSLINTGMSWSGEVSEEQIQEMFRQQDQSQKKETIDIIFEYFRDWRFLKIFKEDISEKELSEWSTYSEEQRKVIVDR
ncbi:MAG: hypothetical protein Q8R55_04735, partial [Candidatus Taylorbacteria bacterium]|nr:hypothetical protein [Candidatus Taylorbacteria bacterium]